MATVIRFDHDGPVASQHKSITDVDLLISQGKLGEHWDVPIMYIEPPEWKSSHFRSRRDGTDNAGPTSLRSTPSMESAHSKRSWTWSDEESSSESEPDHKRVKTRSLSPISTGTSSGRPSLTPSDHHLRLPRILDDFSGFCARRRTAFVDKTECILELPNKFRYLLLRPPRFGKTTLLSTLEQFFDVHGTEVFTEHFGSLAVVMRANKIIPQHNQHLCLSFRLSDLYIYSDITEIASRLTADFEIVLERFLFKYATELRLSDPGAFLTNESGADGTVENDDNLSVADMFTKVFDLVSARGYTLFVSVDDYDFPTRSRSFAHFRDPIFHESYATVPDIECLLDSSLWGPLGAGSDVIDKLFVTGTLSLKSPALQNMHILDLNPTPMRRSCGFTEQEAIEFAKSILVEEKPDMDELRRSCGSYQFSKDGDVVLHPQQIIDRCFELSLQRSRGTESSFQLLSDVLALLPEESDVPDVASTDGLIGLLATGRVEVDDDPLGFDATAINWNVLRETGALICDGPSGGHLRVANSVVLSLIHSHIDSFFADRYNLREVFLDALYSYSMHNNPKLLLQLFTEVLQDETRCCFGKTEPDIRGVLELVMRNKHCTRPDRSMDPIILLPSNATCVRIPGFRKDKVHDWELKTVTLRGIWQATHPNDVEPTIDALRRLHDELTAEDEKQLLARSCAVWSSTLNAIETVLVGSFLDAEPEFPQVLAVGGARVLMRQHPSTIIREEDE
ncbi:hypothetical protein C8R43DRAFT_76245 [Mycena crocata]|nr:hypothetical protein C8R43DRAFT_76245 [Mycena crocata]